MDLSDCSALLKTTTLGKIIDELLLNDDNCAEDSWYTKITACEVYDEIDSYDSNFGESLFYVKTTSSVLGFILESCTGKLTQ